MKETVGVDKFKEILNSAILAGDFQVARGMIAAAIAIAKGDPSAPNQVVPALVLAYTQVFDQELKSLVARSQETLALVDITQEDVKSVLSGGGINGTAH